MSDTHCPKCDWDSESVDGDADAPVVISNRVQDYEFGYLGGEHWIETWTCPICGTVFQMRNSSV